MALYNYSRYTIATSTPSISWGAFSEPQSKDYDFDLYGGWGTYSLTTVPGYVVGTGDYSEKRRQGTFYAVGERDYSGTNGSPGSLTYPASSLREYVATAYTIKYRTGTVQGGSQGAGSYVGNVVAENGTYPTNGRHTDGYWYVRGSVYVPPAPSNIPPTISVSTTDNRTLYENDTFSVSGSATDVNSGNVVNVKYQINNSSVRAITTAISTGAAITFNKVLTFKNKALFDGSTAVTDTLAEGTQHVLKVWAEDDQGGKSAEVIRIFYVVPNRPASLIINPFTISNDLINSDKITISGNVSDPDSNTVTVKYKIANGSFTEVYSGNGGAFSFQILLSALTVGKNTITIQATDSYGAITSKTLSVNKTEKNQPLLSSVVRYKLTPPNVTAKGVVLWIQREVGDLVVGAEISMGASGAAENFVPMTKSATAFVATGIEEDEFIYENATAVENIVLKLTLTRTNVTSTEGIKQISGVLS